jgi:hypothetical protein
MQSKPWLCERGTLMDKHGVGGVGKSVRKAHRRIKNYVVFMLVTKRSRLNVSTPA